MVAERHDAIGRRKRTTPTSTGKRLTPQEADLIWFEKLYEHGSLPSSYLLAFTRHLRRSDKRASERLTDLFNEAETKHGGRYLERPPQQFRTIDSRYNQLVYEATDAARQALNDAGRLAEPVAGPSGPWLHRFMVSCVTASIELGTLERPDLTYIPQHRILARAKAELRYPVTFAESGSGRSITKDLMPDAVFGLEYHTDAGSRFRFFAVECDRATEPATTTNFNRKSWLRSLLQYRSYIGNRGYQDHLELTAPLLVLTVVSDEQRLDRMLKVTSDEAGAHGNAYMLFQVASDFGPVFRPPPAMTTLLSGHWRRAGAPNFRIDRS
ncbi:MAG: replication-relaxation family protein [Nitratireductor sp.]